MSLLTQGREPRRPLLLRPEPGSRQVVTAVHASTVTVETGGRATPSPPVPATRMTFLIHVQSVSPEGEARYDFTLEAVDLLVEPRTPAAAVEEARSRLAFLPGLTGQGTASRRGNTLRLALPAHMDARLRREMQDLVKALQFVGSPFPQEPVGVGACWEEPLYASGPGGASGTSSFELVAAEGERVTTRFLIQQTTRDQPVPAEYQTRPDSSERMMVRAQSTGETLFRLDRLWPVRCRMEMRIQADLSAEEEDPPRRLRTITDIRMHLDEQQA